MKNKKKPKSGEAKIQLPRDALMRINLGQSFAEYDKVLQSPGAFVTTPAALAAEDLASSKLFFVGRRGTGKTAITYRVTSTNKNAIQLHPQTFALLSISLSPTDRFKDTRQKPFKSLVFAFKRAILDQVVVEWIRRHVLKAATFTPPLSKERNYIDDYDFDERVLAFMGEFLAALTNADDKEWLRLVRRSSKDLVQQVDTLYASHGVSVTILFDRIDESWDGSDQAVIMLMALMHACIELSAQTSAVRLKLFLRENIFERVREIDNEFSRLETFVVSMDWTQELLLELIERRLNIPFNTKLPLRGPTWDYFFESTGAQSSRSMVFEYCQERPRDLLTYCSFAIESAQSRKHERVAIEDLQSARRKFSDSRLKDLGDEYAENYPRLHLVLAKFFGLGKEFVPAGMTSFIKKLISDPDIKEHCSKWIFQYTNTEQFIHLLYNIGFVGIGDGSNTSYRSLGAKAPVPPPINATTRIVIHPSYVDALNLQNAVIGPMDESMPLRMSGILTELPGSLDLNEYYRALEEAMDELKTLPTGDENAARFEELVGTVIRLCFFSSLSNLQPQSRSADGRVRRDWIASNRAAGGFWEMVRHRYHATQVIWECKNYAELDAGAFHQIVYYMTGPIGGFGLIAFRGEVKSIHYDHIRRIAQEKKGCVVLLTDKDLMVFMRQARNGKSKEDHIQDIYDRTVRAIS